MDFVGLPTQSSVKTILQVLGTGETSVGLWTELAGGITEDV